MSIKIFLNDLGAHNEGFWGLFLILFLAGDALSSWMRFTDPIFSPLRWDCCSKRVTQLSSIIDFSA